MGSNQDCSPEHLKPLARLEARVVYLPYVLYTNQPDSERQAHESLALPPTKHPKLRHIASSYDQI